MNLIAFDWSFFFVHFPKGDNNNTFHGKGVCVGRGGGIGHLMGESKVLRYWILSNTNLAQAISSYRFDTKHKLNQKYSPHNLDNKQWTLSILISACTKVQNGVVEWGRWMWKWTNLILKIENIIYCF